ncbi:VOC family protein, partial [Streptomyces sp. NPDC006265]|uniref:VOC family protein n=1 Tax=Streptomyces sp. NPDC006265 TaxID=3156740 RepID=UPI0033BA3A15
MRRIALVTLVVDDYDEAIRFYTDALGFRLVEDAPRPEGSRWVVVEPGSPGSGTGLLLARAKGEAQAARVGDQTGGRVGFFLHTDDFARDHARMRLRTRQRAPATDHGRSASHHVRTTRR